MIVWRWNELTKTWYASWLVPLEDLEMAVIDDWGILSQLLDRETPGVYTLVEYIELRGESPPVKAISVHGANHG